MLLHLFGLLRMRKASYGPLVTYLRCRNLERRRVRKPWQAKCGLLRISNKAEPSFSMPPNEGHSSAKTGTDRH